MENGGSKENKMGVMPVGRLLVSMSVPMMAFPMPIQTDARPNERPN